MARKAFAEIGMALREVGCGGHCLPDQLDRLIRIVPRRGDHTEQMEGIRISRRLQQKLLVERLSALEPSSPMVFEGDSQFGGRHRVSPLIHAITGASQSNRGWQAECHGGGATSSLSRC